MPEMDEKKPVVTRDSRAYVLSGSVLAALLWGSAALILAISHLRFTTLTVNQPNILQSASSFTKYSNTIDTSSRIGFEQTRNSSFSPEFKAVQWISGPDSIINDKGLYTTEVDSAYVIKSVQDGNYSQVIYQGTNLTYNNFDYEITGFVSSPNLELALIQTNRTHHWRHSSFSLYWILDVKTGGIVPLHSEKLSVAEWSPTSDHIAYVLGNNVYVYDLAAKKSIQTTFDGGATIFNGKPDWVYEEEVFESDSALWWSPSGTYLSFLRTNDTLVPTFPIPYFVQDDIEGSYPKLTEIKYPKAGYENPNVELAFFNLETEKTDYLDYHYDIFTEVLWVGDEQLLLKATDRESDFLKVVLIDADTLKWEIIRDEVADSWFEITHDTFFVPKSESRKFDGYIDTISVNGYNHLAYYSPPSNSTPKLLTQGNWEVVSAPTAFDQSKNLVYYFSTQESSIERHLYSVDLLSGETKKYTEGEAWYSATFSSGSRFVALTYRGPGIPTQKIVDLYTGNETVLTTNDMLAELLNDYEIPTKIFGEVDVGTTTVNFIERLPPNFDPKKKYPMLFFMYGGPGSQQVAKSFSISFPEVVSSQLDAVVVTIDGRGTGFKGREFRSVVRNNLGHYEVIDQIASAKHWAAKEYIDEDRVAIFGWSYGGFMTLKTLEADGGETFQYGMSVAPVTDFRLYDSIYTERYMHSPQNNPSGYDNTTVSNVENLGKATRFLLMHGTGDDNVHFQNSLMLLDRINLAGVENYDVHVFPDSDHSISYHNAGTIVYNKLFNWLRKAFNGDFIEF